MFFPLSEEQRIFRESARRFAQKRIASLQEEDEKNCFFRREIISEMGELGFLGGLIPEECEGSSVGYLCSIIVQEEIARVNASYAGYFMCQLADPPSAMAIICLDNGGRYRKKTMAFPMTEGTSNI